MSPYISFVVYRDPLTNKIKARALFDREKQNNSHDSICHAHDVNSDLVLKVEIPPKVLRDATFPAPWSIDRLPHGVKHYDDLDPEIIAATDQIVAELLTPDNMYAYICNAIDGDSIVVALFTEDYYQTWKEWFHSLPIDSDRTFINLMDAIAPTDGLMTAAVTQMPELPMFTRAQIRNPVIWTELPAEDE